MFLSREKGGGGGVGVYSLVWKVSINGMHPI